MSKSMKLKNNNYWDSSSIVHNKKNLKDILDYNLGEIIVEDVKCKNLYNPSLVTLSGSNYMYIYNIDNSQTYTFKTSYEWTFIQGIDANGQTTRTVYEKNKTKDSRVVVFVPNSNEIKIRCAFYSSKTITDFTNVQLELGDIATDYVPYKEFENNEVYSTNEVRIGTWIDGKPLYKKTIKMTLDLSTSGAHNYNIGGIPIDTLVDIEYKLNSSHYQQVYNSAITALGIIDSTKNLYMYTNVNWDSDIQWTFTLKYTKTTD